MCGISAVFKYNHITENDRYRLRKMNAEMIYRGPDEQGEWHDERCGMAQTRLSIIGLDNGHQPIFNEDKSLVLICNGEIYNYKELSAKLKNKGHILRTQSDSEIIIHLYEEYGTECLHHLQGMFAFCLYDTRLHRLFCARDRVGEKTLYYASVQCGIVFSTELKAITKHYIDNPQVDVRILAECIRHGYPMTQRHTFIEQIKRLQPGEYALVDERGIETHTYWNRYCLPKFCGTREEAKEEVLRLIQSSVKGCLESDVPVAVLLSGGIDSSTVAHFAKTTGKEIHCISAGYKGHFEGDERSVAKKFAKREGIIYHEVELDADDFIRYFDEYTAYIDEPIADIASIAQWAIYKKAKQMGFTVLLGGLGGDELFYGYELHNRCGEALKVRHTLDATHSRIEWLNTFIRNLRFLDPHRRMRLDGQWPVDWLYQSYLKFAETATISANGDKHSLSGMDVNYYYPYDSDVNTVYDLLFSNFMTMQCLYLADRLGMGNSIELRSPLVDYRLVEFVSSLPLEIKYTPGKPKQFLKDILSGIIPNEILYGQKRGFTPPTDYINRICRSHSYKNIESEHSFFNSLLADKLISSVTSK